jgi:hypothetical protein
LGQAQLIEIGVALSEDGKENVRRRWGYFDVNDGIFFESNGTSKNIVIRSSINDSITETVISQSAWNVDTLDGTNGASNPSDILLDLSKTNLFWVDMQYPIGQIRFGIFDEAGTRHIIHSHQGANTDTVPLMRRSALPVRWEVENLDTAISTSELRVFGANVWTEGKDSRAGDLFGIHSHTSGSGVVVDDQETYLFSFRPRVTYKNQRNKIVSLFESVEVLALTGSQEAPIKIKMWVAPILVGDTYGTLSSNLEVDEDASSHFGFINIGEFYIRGQKKIDLTNISNYTGVSRLNLKADDFQPVISFTAQGLIAGSSNNVFASLIWREVID